MNKKILIGIIILSAFLIAGSAVFSSRKNTHQNKLQIAASFYPLAEITEEIGKEKTSVITLTPAGAEPHDFNPDPEDRINLQQSKIFIYNGAGLEPWVSRVLPDLKNIELIDASKEIQLLSAGAEKNENENKDEKKTLYDPHFWLDPILMKKIVNTVSLKLVKIDPENKSFYKNNAAAYSEKLSNLDSEFRNGLMNCKKKEIITSHKAFAYLAARYEFTQIPIAGISEEEPSPARLSEIARIAKEKNIKYVFFETLVSPRLSETIAKETGAKTLVLNPVEGLTLEEKQQGKNYISIMRENLTNLKIALECL